MNLVDAFPQGLEPVHVDDGRRHRHHHAEHGRAEATNAADFDLKSKSKHIFTIPVYF